MIGKDKPGIDGKPFTITINKEWFTDFKKDLTFYGHKRVLDMFDELYEEVKHGDEEHMKWLKDKIEDFKARI